ncbi:polysaccharide pyruvyl transferase family protein [Pontibacter sp. SGAir0037]|uniref:polysaccharide pyruvyl transferase family protein n=1 Tax=Pontibacter sp. SGAir0037 TaxID=2571030 RepID=UPI0010CD2CC1|nr:polysaccharide pyruvyl transferase family protein [Pontibacter sp. SGAir0037]QCR22606.1 succinoglycan biosynthesis ketolase [Pontibacter sp. SGAir0037]
MKLIYFRENKNFGDALNPIIFGKFLPDFFDEDDSTVFLGIGSILQFRRDAKHKIIFSSGFAYGELPTIDSSYDVQCVRGPLTAKKLGISEKLAITDGAALLRAFNMKHPIKKYKFSFMPHHGSLHFYDWKRVCEEVGYHFIDPLGETDDVLSQILQSEVVIAEAMHGAIVADTLRVPWIPVKFYKSINEFKWLDWTQSLNLQYEPTVLRPLYDKASVSKKITTRFGNIPDFIIKQSAQLYTSYQDAFLQKSIIRDFAKLRHSRIFLSRETLLDEKVERLLYKLEHVQLKYERIIK